MSFNICICRYVPDHSCLFQNRNVHCGQCHWAIHNHTKYFSGMLREIRTLLITPAVLGEIFDPSGFFLTASLMKYIFFFFNFLAVNICSGFTNGETPYRVWWSVSPQYNQSSQLPDSHSTVNLIKRPPHIYVWKCFVAIPAPYPALLSHWLASVGDH